MALPVAISDGDVGLQNSYHGPFKSSGGNYYVVLTLNPGTNQRVWKASDPTSSFSQIAGTNLLIGCEESHNTIQVSDHLHCVGNGAGFGTVYGRFDMSDDGFEETDVGVDSAPDGTAYACDIAVLSASYGVGSAFVKIRVVYQGETDMDMGGEYERVDESNSVNDGVDWSAPTQIDNGASVPGLHYTGPRIVLPPNNSDQCHVFMTQGFIFRQRAIAGDDTLRTFRNTLFNVHPDFYPITHGIGFMRSSMSKVRIGYREQTTNDLEIYEMDAFSDDTDHTSEDDSTNVSTDDVQADNESINACLTADGSVIRGLMVKASDDDLYEFYDDNADSYTLNNQIFSRVLTGTSDESIGVNSATEKLACSFVADTTGEVKHGQFRLEKTGTPTDNLTISIETDSSGEPSGSSVVVFNDIACSDLTTSPANYSVSASTAGSLTNGTTYWVVYDRSGGPDVSNYPEVIYSDDSDAGTGRKYWNGSVWGSLVATVDAEFVLSNIVAGTVNHVSCRMYDRDGPKLAMVYDNAGTVYYDEVAITITESTLSTVDMGQQNSFHGPFEI